jgi:uncharacterized protein with ATP-grasp and redox domains
MVNLRLQKAILEVVENQIRENNPPETRKTLDRLLKKGYSKGDAMKLIGSVVAVEIYEILKNKEPFNEERYVKALRELR